jgi:hypothetical protein
MYIYFFGGAMKNKIVVFDLLFYLALPYLIWKFGQEPLGDYYAILLSTAPGFVYTIVRFAVGFDHRYPQSKLERLAVEVAGTVTDRNQMFAV